MEEIKQVLQAVFKELTEKLNQNDFDAALKTWQRIVGEKAARHTKIVYLTKDKIQVNVDSSVWLHELNLKKRSIQARLQEALKIQKVILRLGEI